MVKKIFNINGMHCNSCASKIEDALKDKVNSISVNFAKGQAEIDFENGKISENKIEEIIKDLGYEINTHVKKSNALYWHIGLLSIITLAVLFIFFKNLGLNIPEINFNELENVSLLLLFFAGLLTGFHCIAMCGGFMVSYTAKNAINGHKSFLQHLIYGTSKTISYTIIGAFFGLIGSIFFFTPQLRGTIAIFAGIFMIAYSLSMFGISFFKKFQFNPKFLTKIATKKYSGHYIAPMTTGLLNGLFIACGPLQALYIYAAGTGSMIQGGLSLMAFGLGTMPVMLGFGGITNVISKNTTKKILKISAIIVLILGLIMLNRGFSLIGSGYDVKSLLADNNPGQTNNIVIDSEGYQVIEMTVDGSGWTPDTFVLQKGIPVRWVIDGQEITNCNNAIQVPKLNLNFPIQKGKQTIEFTPTEVGVIPWSCWMGMIPGTFIVTDDGTATQKEIQTANTKTASSGGCGCGGGSSGSCGG
ncbi:MAG TPA: sulfite exporter TauE/SafE family protein [Candidatus Nanoarchaeia archaeon]|nr:sulfite exporter TauE/SafE family protein [Candidatus Nanoarchaeia archaeon]